MEYWGQGQKELGREVEWIPTIQGHHLLGEGKEVYL